MRLLSFTLTTLAACVTQQLYAADSVTSEQTLNTITVTATREESTTEKLSLISSRKAQVQPSSIFRLKKRHKQSM